MANCKVPDWAVRIMKDYSLEASEWRCRAKTLEAENKELRDMREKVIKALDSIHDDDEHGNARSYKNDGFITEIRKAVYGEEGFVYKFPFHRETMNDLDRLAIR